MVSSSITLWMPFSHAEESSCRGSMPPPPSSAAPAERPAMRHRMANRPSSVSSSRFPRSGTDVGRLRKESLRPEAPVPSRHDVVPGSEFLQTVFNTRLKRTVSPSSVLRILGGLKGGRLGGSEQRSFGCSHRRTCRDASELFRFDSKNAHLKYNQAVERRQAPPCCEADLRNFVVSFLISAFLDFTCAGLLCRFFCSLANQKYPIGIRLRKNFTSTCLIGLYAT